jgi:hypothetical protein
MLPSGKIVLFACTATFVHLMLALPSYCQNIEITAANGTEIVDGDGADVFKLTDFPNTFVSQTASRTFVIRNTQSPNNLTLALPITVAGSSDFTVIQPPALIAPFDTVQLEIHFAPSSAGTKTAVITINSNDPDSENVYVFGIRGTGFTGLQLLRPDLSVTFKKELKSKFIKKKSTNITKATVAIQNLGPLDMESGVAEIYVSHTNNFDAATELLNSVPIGPLLAPEAGKTPKTKKLKFKLDTGNTSSGRIYVRVIPQLPGAVDNDYVDNQIGEGYEASNK